MALLTLKFLPCKFRSNAMRKDEELTISWQRVTMSCCQVHNVVSGCSQ